VNLASIIDPHPADAIALVSQGVRISYGELRERAGAIRGGLTAMGLTPGDRVAIVCANNRYFVESYLGAIGAGLVVSPLNPTSPAPELTNEIEAIGARAVIAGPMAGAAVARIDRAAVPTVEHLVAARPDDVPGATAYSDLVRHEPVPGIEREPTDLAVLMFTSGTAGSPRAAMLTHGNLRANIDQMQAVEAVARHRDDTTLCVLPLFHIFGLNVVLDPALLVGATVVLVERFDPTAAVESISEHRVTALTGPPTMWATFTQTPDLPPDAFATVRLAASGASRLPVEVAQRMLDRFGLAVTEGYGLTESAPVVAISAGTGAPLGSIGRPLPGVEMRLVDSDGHDVLVGDAGEIWVRGPNVFPGYWNDPHATAGVLDADGWLHTGDIAVIDDDGYLFIVDRAKDLIIVSGFNVYPAEVEEVLVEHPAVAEAAVVGVEHPHTGEAVKAYVVARAGAEVEEDDIIEFVGERLARYKCPTTIRFVDTIPKGLGGKILRRSLT
jgi:long-chain acyl-CoA synthetase